MSCLLRPTMHPRQPCFLTLCCSTYCSPASGQCRSRGRDLGLTRTAAERGLWGRRSWLPFRPLPVGIASQRSQTPFNQTVRGFKCDGLCEELRGLCGSIICAPATAIDEPKATRAPEPQPPLCVSVVKRSDRFAYRASSASVSFTSLSLSKDDGGVEGGWAVSGSQPPPRAR